MSRTSGESSGSAFDGTDNSFLDQYIAKEGGASADGGRFLGYVPYSEPPVARDPGAAARRKKSSNGAGGSALTNSLIGRFAAWLGGGSSTNTDVPQTSQLRSAAAAVASPQPRDPQAFSPSGKKVHHHGGNNKKRQQQEDEVYYASLLKDTHGNAIGDAVKSVDDGLPIRDFIYSSAVGRLYYATRDEICAPFGFYHGQRVLIRKGPLQGMRAVIVGVQAGQLHGIFEGETEASPFLRCYNGRHLAQEYDLVALSEPRAVKLQPLTLPLEVPERVHNFLKYAPDLTLEIDLNQNEGGSGEEEGGGARDQNKNKKKRLLSSSSSSSSSDDDDDDGVNRRATRTTAVAKSSARNAKKTAPTPPPPPPTRRSISFADGPDLEIKSPARGAGTARATRLSGAKRSDRDEDAAAGSKKSNKNDSKKSRSRSDADDDEYNLEWLLSDNTHDDDDEGEESDVEDDDDGAGHAFGTPSSTAAASSTSSSFVPVNPFISFVEPTTPRPGLVVVYLSPTYALAHNGSVGWSGEAMQPISGAGGIGRFPLYNFDSNFTKRTKAQFKGDAAALTALEKQKEYLAPLTQPLLASISATVIVPLVLSFNAVEALASTVEEEEDASIQEGLEGGAEEVGDFLNKVVATSEKHHAKAKAAMSAASAKFGIRTAFEEDADFLSQNR